MLVIKYNSDGVQQWVKTYDGGFGNEVEGGAGRAFSLTLKELSDWRGNRADAGRLAPKEFPRSNRFR